MNETPRRSFLQHLMAAASLQRLASAQTPKPTPPEPDDWLLDGKAFPARLARRNEREIELTNGIVSRVWRIAPNAATVALDDVVNGQAILRSVRPEATIKVNGLEMAVGGLVGQPIHNYLLPEWLDAMTTDPHAFQFLRFEEGRTSARFAWKKHAEWLTEDLPWPPPGVALTLHFEAGAQTAVKDLRLRIHYELYDGIPLMAKWLEIENRGNATVMLDAFRAEMLAVADRTPLQEAGASLNVLDPLQPLHVETDYAFGGFMRPNLDNPAVRWIFDPLYTTGIEYYKLEKPTLLECAPPLGPAVSIEPRATWNSFRVFELLQDSVDQERRNLARKRMVRTLAPWSQENPIFMHARYAKAETVRNLIDQCVETGFEMVILSFGSGFHIEDDSAANLAAMKELSDYAKANKIAIGGYSLLASRGGKAEDQVVDVATGRPGGAHFGPSPCLGSSWGLDYFRKLKEFFQKTGMNVFENDGSYPGDRCASTVHPGHRGYDDSQWKQWEMIRDFYRWCRAEGIYLTVPDWYFLNGSSKTAMGYVETNWSLRREYQEIIERQNIFDGTGEKTPSMGWMHVPLMQYHGGGTDATIEPLHEHLDHYERRLADLFGNGVQAAWRGERLYDTEETKAVVRKWVSFYKAHREILNSDVVHLRRPDGRDWDGMLHVNPGKTICGMAVLYNPMAVEIQRTVRVPLYYTGLKDRAVVRIGQGEGKTVKLSRDYSVEIEVRIAARGVVPVVFSEVG
jgi:hypothetical protein